MAKLLVQNNVFYGVNNPIFFNSDSDTAEVVETGNDYSSAQGDHVSRGTAFVPPYPYELQNTSEVAQAVTAQAGIEP
jgi:pectate lyase